MRRSALQTFFRGALVAAIPFGLGVAQATTPACEATVIVAAPSADGGSEGDSDGGYSTADCNRICGGYGYWCEAAPGDGGAAKSIACHINRCGGSVCGRGTEGLDAVAARSGQDFVAGHFASAAQLEAASVVAFRRLARELSAHGAPARLVARANASADDEVRHARIMGGLARAHGGRPTALPSITLPVRSFEAVAIENAVEGCVLETFGALVASWQALTAGTPRVRRAMRAIAADERRHAELAWAVSRWAEPRLPATTRRRLRAAVGRAVVELRHAVAAEPPAVLVRVAGLPPAAAARTLFGEAQRRLWHARSVSA